MSVGPWTTGSKRRFGEHRGTTSILLKNLIETTGDPGIRNYVRALACYADRLDETSG